MPLFVLLGFDGDGAAALRPVTRPAHLAHWKGLDEAGAIRFGGPLLDAEGRPCGSILVFESLDLAAARHHASRDPYATDGVFGGFEVYETRAVFPGSAS